jgi:3-hexulose-6-phosphate synthase/6-phospho-3-hexuloisomerase
MIKGLSPMDELDEVVAAVKIPVQAVGGLSIQQAIECPKHGAPLVVLGAPLVIDADGFTAVTGERLRTVLSEICQQIRRRSCPS